jgi:uncharacterized membrane protein YjfL (UPF0719 family)
MAKELFIGFAVFALQMLASIVFSAGAIYSGMALFDRMTASIEEWKEMKKGNLAVGLLFASIISSLVILIEPRFLDLVYAIRAPGALLPLETVILVFAFTILNYLLGIIGGLLVIFLAINVIDRITPDLDELAEIKKGNLAVALVLSVALLLIVFIARAPFESAFDSLITIESGFV